MRSKSLAKGKKDPFCKPINTFSQEKNEVPEHSTRNIKKKLDIIYNSYLYPPKDLERHLENRY